MSRKRHTPEQIIRKLREAEVELAKGQRTGDVMRKLGITEQTYYRWRKEYGGLRVDQAKRLKELERENGRLLLHACRGKGPDRALAVRVQHDPAAQLTRLPAAGSRGDRLAEPALRDAPTGLGLWTNIELGTTNGGRSTRWPK